LTPLFAAVFVLGRDLRRWSCLGRQSFGDLSLMTLSRDGNGPRGRCFKSTMVWRGTEVTGGGGRQTEGERRKRERLRCRLGGSGSGSRRGPSPWIAGSNLAVLLYSFQEWKMVQGAGVACSLPGRWCLALPGSRARTKGNPGGGRTGGGGRSINVGAGRNVGEVGGMIGEAECEFARINGSSMMARLMLDVELMVGNVDQVGDRLSQRCGIGLVEWVDESGGGGGRDEVNGSVTE
jgi:hypothetical protein